MTCSWRLVRRRVRVFAVVVSCFCPVVRAGVRCCVCALPGLCVACAPCPGVLLRRRGDTPSLWRARLAPWRALLAPGCGPARGSGVCARWGGGGSDPSSRFTRLVPLSLFAGLPCLPTLFVPAGLALARSSGLLYPAWVLSTVRRGKQPQFVCWIQVRTTDGKFKLAKCLIHNGSEVNLVRRGFLQEDEAKMSSTPVQLEGVSGHRLEGGDREAELAVRLVKQSVWSVEETVLEEWFSGKFYEATIKYDFFFGQPWLHAHRVSPMGHRTCFLQDPSTSNPSDLYYLHPYTKSIHQFKERNKLHIQRDGQEWTGNQEEFAEGKVESLNCKKWKSVCYRVVDGWRDILVDYFEKNHNFRQQVDAFANNRNKRFPKFYDDAWSEDWSEPLWINTPFDVFPRVVQELKQSGAKAILIVPNWPKQSWFKDIMDISIDIVELPHKGVKLYCEDNGKPLLQRSWSTLACLVDGKLGDYWRDDSEMGTEEVISNSSGIDEIEVDRDDRERNSDISSLKEGRTIGVRQKNASIHLNSSPSDKNQAKNVKISSKDDDKFQHFHLN